MAKRLTLAEQLAQISEPAPADFDPEDSYATYNAEKSKDAQDLNAGRADYVQVGPSGLRKKGEAVVDAKYAGKAGSRKALYGDSEDEDDEDDEQDDEMEDEDEDDEMDDLRAQLEGEGSEEEEEDSEGEEGGAFDEEDEEISEGEEEEEEEDIPAPAPKRKSSGSSKAKEQNEKAMLSQLKQAASADVEKGRDVKKQLAFCDSLLESRIRIQKSTISTNTLPQPPLSSTIFSLLPSELAETLAEVEGLNEEMFELRKEMLGSVEGVSLPKGLGGERKRKRGGVEEGEVEEYVKANIKDLGLLEAALTPFLRSTITKWSDKVLAASGLSLTTSKKFKAVNQNAMVSIDHALSSAERERLVKRTRVRRDAARGVVGKVEQVPLEGEKKKGDDEVFDDGDFYGQLLRDVVESRMLDLDDPTLQALRLASARGKKVKKVVDTRASKGRKIRYHVHEKVQNFMIPIDAGGWHEAQVDELFASLLGRTFPMSKEEKERREAEEARAANGAAGGGAVEVGSLRIFG